jgi:predicted SnoaL-like aldol condensation-catalyzing enzyme
MVDGPSDVVDIKLTEANRALVRSLVEAVLIGGQFNRLTEFIDEEAFAEHNPRLGDGVSILRSALEAELESHRCIEYRRVHRVLAEGNFVLCVSEGNNGGIHSAFYDLFRLANGKVVEHWDTTEKIAPQSEWKNDNGKF